MNWECSRERAGGCRGPEWDRQGLIHEVGGGGDDENRHEPHEASPDGAGVPRRYVQRPLRARTHTYIQRDECT